ncbi:MAG: hypothetical protein AAF449_01940 [Myxococcota bacterium]
MTDNYSEDTEGARDSIELARPWVEEAIRQIEADRVSFGDYGAANGGTALTLYRSVIESAGSRPATFVLNDLPGADWHNLAANGARAVEGRPDDVVYLSPRSFYERIAPPGSINVGFSATAMHWLSKKPADLPDHFSKFLQATGAVRGTLRHGLEDASYRDQAGRLPVSSEIRQRRRCRAVRAGADAHGALMECTHLSWCG